MAISFADIALNHTDTEHVSLLDDPGVMVNASVLLCGGCYFFVLGQAFIQFLNVLVEAIELTEYYSLLLSPALLPPISVDNFLKI